MYPARELSRLAARKATLVHDIAGRRAQCATAARQVTRPLAWLDRVMDLWRQCPPLARVAAVPLACLALRAVVRRRRFIRAGLRWTPWLLGGLRVLRVVFPGRRTPAST